MKRAPRVCLFAQPARPWLLLTISEQLCGSARCTLGDCAAERSHKTKAFSGESGVYIYIEDDT